MWDESLHGNLKEHIGQLLIFDQSFGRKACFICQRYSILNKNLQVDFLIGILLVVKYIPIHVVYSKVQENLLLHQLLHLLSINLILSDKSQQVEILHSLLVICIEQEFKVIVTYSLLELFSSWVQV
jgi:hypothetical protein